MDWDIVDAAEDSDDEEGEDYDATESAGLDLKNLGVAVVSAFETLRESIGKGDYSMPWMSFRSTKSKDETCREF